MVYNILNNIMSKKNNRSTFAQNLIAIRKSKGISQRELASLTGISSRMIAYYETRVEIPAIDKLTIIADALNVSISDLMDDKVSDKEFLKLNTRTLKKVQLLEELTPENQRKILDHIKALLAQQKIEEQNKPS